MGEETSDTMNLDLNLGPTPDSGSIYISTDSLNSEDLIDDPDRIREAVSWFRARQRRRWRQVPVPTETRNSSPGNVDTLQTGEGSVAAEERMNDTPKVCKNVPEDRVLEKKVFESGSVNEGSFFDCNICLDLSRDPVVTCCGHLFCWACLYSWLNVHSEAKECPVCKGEVSIKNVTPIYGRGRGSTTHGAEEDPSPRIPLRPHPSQVENLRQTSPIEDSTRGLGPTRDLTSPHTSSSPVTPERSISFLNRFLTSRMQSLDSEGARISSLSSVLHSAERFVEAYFSMWGAVRRNEEQAPAMDDRDSFSSIAAMINPESQMDTAMEIDSMVSLSTLSSRRRNDQSRASDVDSVDSRAPRRRRLR